MIDALKFVQGAVGKKDFVPALTHFRIRDGRIMGHNGKLCLSAPIDINLDCAPKADAFYKAVQMCDETVQLHITPAGKLAIRSGSFRAFIDCVPLQEFPEVEPEGVPIGLADPLLPALRTLYEFTAEDASRPWAAAVLLRGHSAYATNNIILVQFWLTAYFPYVLSVPRMAIKELLRVNREPVAIQATSNSISFHFEDGSWLRSSVQAMEWPDVNGVFDRCPPVTASVPPEGLREALAKVAPFTCEHRRVRLRPGEVATDHDGEAGAAVAVPALDANVNFNIDYLQQCLNVTNTVAFADRYAVFYGEGLRGVIMGLTR